MPKLSEIIGSLTINGKKYNNPEWWNTKHKLNKAIKNTVNVKQIVQESNLKISMTRNSLEHQPRIDTYVQTMRAKLDLDEYKEFAPWNPIFQKRNTAFIFKYPKNSP